MGNYLCENSACEWHGKLNRQGGDLSPIPHYHYTKFIKRENNDSGTQDAQS